VWSKLEQAPASAFSAHLFSPAAPHDKTTLPLLSAAIRLLGLWTDTTGRINKIPWQELAYQSPKNDFFRTDSVALTPRERSSLVGDNSVVGADAVVTKNQPDFSFTLCVPATVRRTLNS
jgi:hypothetical protein